MSRHSLRHGLAAGLVLASVVPLVAGCSLANDAGTEITAPLIVLPDTDVVVETNLKTAQQSLDTGASAFGAASGTDFVAGASSGPAVISKATSVGGATVLAGFNPLSDDCLGLLIVPAASTPVLGENEPGTYYYWERHSSVQICDAASFAASGSVPSGWQSGDPSASSWPGF